MQELNIVELIEKNPISKLSKVYNNKLINKIKDNFNGFESQLFVSSFYCYLNYDKNIDFVVDLDDIWKWLGFQQKIDCRRLLEKHFKLHIDYKTAPEVGGAVFQSRLQRLDGGQCGLSKFLIHRLTVAEDHVANRSCQKKNLPVVREAIRTPL